MILDELFKQATPLTIHKGPTKWRAETEINGRSLTELQVPDTLRVLRGHEVLTLPPDLIWSNEFAWRPIEQTSQHTTTGALGTAYSVIFDHAAGALKAEPVVAFADPIDADWYIPTLYFLTA